MIKGERLQSMKETRSALVIRWKNARLTNTHEKKNVKFLENENRTLLRKMT